MDVDDNVNISLWLGQFVVDNSFLLGNQIFGRGGYHYTILIGTCFSSIMQFLSCYDFLVPALTLGGQTVPLSLRFEEAAEQFRLDVAQNPNDTEESIWCFLCEAQLYGVDEARRRFLEVNELMSL